MKIKFCGAAQNVTGSRHLLEVNHKKILLDCGLFQGGARKVSRKNNEEFLFDPKDIDAVIISHAHIDHLGNIPRLVKLGFNGPIHMTTVTKKLARVMLIDSAKIQIQDADFLRRHFKEEIEPLYSEEDVQASLKLMKGHAYDKTFSVLPKVNATLYDAGHVFGSAQVFLEVQDGQYFRKIAFTGDLGRKYMPILNDPNQIPEADILITESTYADHLHDTFEYVFDELEMIINDVVKRGGKIIVPGFSLERTQEIVYVLHKLYLEKKIPAVPIFVDSPLSTKISKIFMQHTDYYDDQAFQDFLGRAKSPFAFSKLTYITDKEESKKLNRFNKPAIIIASSGMCQAGRIKHHLRNYISDPKNLILVIGFMAKGTLGRRIVGKKRRVRIYGEYFDLKADVVALNEFSAHADKLELLENIKNMKGLKEIFIVHGEELQTHVMRDNIYNELDFKGRVEVPVLGEEYILENSKVVSMAGKRRQRSLEQLKELKDTEAF
jgi:metallo-beta-lactamase family protein